MLEDAIRDSKESFKELKLEMKEIRLEIEKASNRAIYKTVGILGGLYLVVGSLSTIAHRFLH